MDDKEESEYVDSVKHWTLDYDEENRRIANLSKEEREIENAIKIHVIYKFLNVIKQYVVWAFWIWIVSSLIWFIITGALKAFLLQY